tara:strand:+ start:4355 stop:7252 length:2898 start_codon:yes stop_codon:yes gene_type:complete
MSRKKSKRAYKKASSSSLDPALHRYIQEFHKYFDNQCYAQALAIADRLADSFPDLPEAWELKANALGHLDRMREAANSMSIAYTLLSDESPATLLKFAQYQLLAGFTEEALKNLKTLAKLDPNNEKVFAWTSRAYHALGKNEEAIAVNDKAFKIAPLDPETLLWRSRIMDQAKRPTEARKAALQLKEISPERIGVSNHIASLDLREGLYESAEYHFDQELLLEDNANVSINKLVAMHYNPSYTADNIYQATCSWQEKYVDRSLVNRAKTVRRASKRVRLGLLSGSFRVHPVGQMILPVLQYIDNLEVELFAYNTNHASDIITKEIKECIANWANVGGLNDEELEKKIRQDKIDILIDLNGGGEGSRYLMLSREPAPLIVKWVGMLINTTGLECFDYLLSDSIETPSNVGALYTEKLIRLPDDYICYKIPEYIPDINSLPALKNGYVTFGCLNNPAKLSPPLIKEWSKLLEELPGSKLLLRGIQFEGEDFCQRMIARFSEHGINSDRLLLQGPAKHQEFLGTYRHIDIALDTWPYSGGLTTCEALAMGVPVVTCVGPTFAGRHSATHLANAGLPELVTDNWDDFRKRAKELASDLPSLAVIRAALRTILRESPVCDGERFAKHFTKAMRGIWQRHCEGKAPEALTFNKEGDAWFADEDQPIELVEVEAEPEPQEAELEWSLESPITVIDNGALFARHPRFTEWMQTGNFAVITFDPGSLLTKQADELKQIGEWHHYPHATLGDGNSNTLYATLDPELTGTLRPFDGQQKGGLSDPLRVLSTLPISTVQLDAVEGLPSVDVLVLDEFNDAMKILLNGSKYLSKSLLIKVKVSFSPSHEKQPDLTQIRFWADENGFKFYDLIDLEYYDSLNSEGEEFGGEIRSAEAIFIPKFEVVKSFSDGLKIKLAYCLYTIVGFYDLACKIYNMLEAKPDDVFIVEKNKTVPYDSVLVRCISVDSRDIPVYRCDLK